MQRKHVHSAVMGSRVLRAYKSLFLSLAVAVLCAQANSFAAETGDDNPTGVSGIYTAVTTGGLYDPNTGNAHRGPIDDIFVPGAVGSYPLKWTRYWNCRGQTPHTAGKWNYSYIGYAFATVTPPQPGPTGGGEPGEVRSQNLALFPDGRALNYTDFDPPGVEDRVRGNQILLADGGKVIMGGPSGPNMNAASITSTASEIIDPYEHRTTIVTTGTGSTKTTKITEPGGRYLLVSYNANGTVSGVQAFDGVNSQPIQSVSYAYSSFRLTTGAWLSVLTGVNYNDGSSATYSYTEVTYSDWPSSNPSQDTPAHSAIVKTCRDVRYGPMRDIAYQYYTDQNAHPRMVSENHLLASGQVGEVVSSVTGAGQFTTTPVETRGDGAQRSFTYNPPAGGGIGIHPLAGKLLKYTDFYFSSGEQHTTYLTYETDTSKPSAGFITAVTDANGAYEGDPAHKTTYTRSTLSWGITKITHPPTASEPQGSYMQQEFTDEVNPYFLKSRTDENLKKTTYTRDDPANPNAITRKDYPDGSSETFAYNNFGQVTTHRLKNGAYQYFQYDTRGLLLAKWNPTWNTTRLDSDPKTTYSYYTSGPWTDRVYRETDPRGNITEYEHDRVLDANGENSGASGLAPCGGRGLVTRINYPNDTHNGTIPNGTFKSFGYDKWGNKLWEENELRQRTTYTYDEYNRLTSAKTPSPINGLTAYDYSPTKGNPTLGYRHTTKSAYFVTDPTNIVTAKTFDPNWRTKSTIAGFGTLNLTTLFGYDFVGNPTTVTDPLTHTTTTDYDQRNRKWHIIDALQHKTTFGYDPASNITSITRPDLTIESKTYDAMNRVLTDTVPKDGTPQNVTETVQTQFQYYPGTAATMAGELWHVIDSKNQTTTFEYDPSGPKTKMLYPKDNLGNSNPLDYQAWTYDPAKNLIARRTVNGVSQLFSYDERNRVFTMTWSNAADWSIFDYDAAGRMTTAQNPTSTISRQYDPAGRLTVDGQRLSILPISAVSRKTHGSAGSFDIALPLIGKAGLECRKGQGTNSDQHQIIVTFPRPITFTSAGISSGTGNISSTSTSADSKQVTINLTGVTNAQTIIVTLSGVRDGTITNDVKIGMGVVFCDVNGNGLVSSGDTALVQSQSGQVVTSSNFRDDVDVNGLINSTDVGLVQSKSGTGITLPQLTQPVPTNPSIDVQYSYDADGKGKELYVTSANYGVTYGYDIMGRFQTISARSTGTLEFQYGYDAASNEVSRTNLLTGVKQDYGTPDALNRTTQRDVKLSNGSVISHEGYSYDSSRPGLLTSVDREDGKRDAFGYDLLPELNSAQYGLVPAGATWINPQRQVGYIWDKAGNRVSVVDGVATTNYQTTNLNQYSNAGTAVTNGNEHELETYQNVTYKYINDSHLSSITGTDVFNQQSSYQLLYDAVGRCAVRVLNGTTTYYIYDGEKPILEYAGNLQAPIASNLYGKSIDEILMRTDYTASPARTVYYQDDHEGSVTHLMMLVNNVATVVESYRYDVFGKPTINGGARIDSAFNNRFMFTGREYVANFGIYEYRNRAYHPGLGRFMSEDPKLFDAGDYNLFRYCGNDPLDRTDPMGLMSPLEALVPHLQQTRDPDLGQNSSVAWVTRVNFNPQAPTAQKVEPQGSPPKSGAKGISLEGTNPNLAIPKQTSDSGFSAAKAKMDQGYDEAKLTKDREMLGPVGQVNGATKGGLLAGPYYPGIGKIPPGSPHAGDQGSSLAGLTAHLPIGTHLVGYYTVHIHHDPSRLGRIDAPKFTGLFGIPAQIWMKSPGQGGLGGNWEKPAYDAYPKPW